MGKLKEQALIEHPDRHLQEPYIEEKVLDFARWLLHKTQIGEFCLDMGNFYTPEELYELFKEEN